MSRLNVRCALFGHRWGRNRAPGLRHSGGYCLCERCGEMGFVV
jgi:hypothetical protein